MSGDILQMRMNILCEQYVFSSYISESFILTHASETVHGNKNEIYRQMVSVTVGDNRIANIKWPWFG